jgi:hypothetical protein
MLVGFVRLPKGGVPEESTNGVMPPFLTRKKRLICREELQGVHDSHPLGAAIDLSASACLRSTATTGKGMLCRKKAAGSMIHTRWGQQWTCLRTDAVDAIEAVETDSAAKPRDLIVIERVELPG